MLSAAMMLRYGLGDGAAADRIENAVDAVLGKGLRTPDIYEGGEGETRVGTEEVTAAVLAELGQG
jgi:3-isopropylmalate dehydrogenase